MQAYLLAALNAIKSKIEKIVGVPIIIEPITFNQTNYYTYACIRVQNEVKEESPRICNFSLVQIPGCCGILIATAIAIAPRYIGKGIGKLLLRAREDAALNAGYTVLLETCTEQANAREIGLLEKYGYKRIDRFVNARTGNTVIVLTKNLREPVKAIESKV